jgi:threonine synthase
MDISNPNNFPRVIELGERHGLPLADSLRSVAIGDPSTRQAMQTLWGRGYLADPHSALAWLALDEDLEDGEQGVFLCTAHPAKFLEVIEATLGIDVPLPPALEAVRNKDILSQTISGEFEVLKAVLRS